MHELTPNAKMSGQIPARRNNIYDKQVDPVADSQKSRNGFPKAQSFPNNVHIPTTSRLVKVDWSQEGREPWDEIVKRSLERATLWDEVKDDLRKPGTSISGGSNSGCVCAGDCAASLKSY